MQICITPSLPPSTQANFSVVPNIVKSFRRAVEVGAEP